MQRLVDRLVSEQIPSFSDVRDLSVWRVFGQPSGLRGQLLGLAKDTCFLTQGRWQLSYSIHREQNYINFNNASLGSWN